MNDATLSQISPDPPDTPANSLTLPRFEIAILSTFVEQFLAYSKDVLLKKSKSMKGYRVGLKRFINYYASLPSTPPFSDELCRSYKTFLEREVSANTRQVYLNAVRLFCQYLEETKVINWNPMANIRSPKISPIFKKQPLSVDEVHQLLTTIPTDTLVQLRDKTIIYLMLKTGLREVEILRANLEDYQTIPDGRILRVWGKGREEADNFVVLVPEVTELLDQYLAARPMPTAKQLHQASAAEELGPELRLPLFLTTGRRGGHRLSEITMQGVVREWLKLANVKRAPITGHSLRHTAATMSLDGGAPITAVKDMLRHSSIKQTNIYVHTMERVKRGGESFINQY